MRWGLWWEGVVEMVGFESGVKRVGVKQSAHVEQK